MAVLSVMAIEGDPDALVARMKETIDPIAGRKAQQYAHHQQPYYYQPPPVYYYPAPVYSAPPPPPAYYYPAPVYGGPQFTLVLPFKIH